MKNINLILWYQIFEYQFICSDFNEVIRNRKEQNLSKKMQIFRKLIGRFCIFGLYCVDLIIWIQRSFRFRKGIEIKWRSTITVARAISTKCRDRISKTYKKFRNRFPAWGRRYDNPSWAPQTLTNSGSGFEPELQKKMERKTSTSNIRSHQNCGHI